MTVLVIAEHDNAELNDATRAAVTAACEQVGDYVSRQLFDEILKSEEEHIDYLETQLSIIEKIGEERYMQSQLSPGEMG